MPAYSTSTHPGTPIPNQDEWQPSGSAGPLPFFSQIIRVRAANPVLGSLPAFPQLLESLADGLDAHLMGTQPLLEAHLSCQFQSPEAGGLVEGARALVQYLPESLPGCLVEDGLCAFGAGGEFIQASQSLAVKGMNEVTDCLGGTSHAVSNLGRALSLAAGKEDLATAQDKAIGGAQASLELLLLLLSQLTDKHLWLHAHSMAYATKYCKTSPSTSH